MELVSLHVSTAEWVHFTRHAELVISSSSFSFDLFALIHKWTAEIAQSVQGLCYWMDEGGIGVRFPVGLFSFLVTSRPALEVDFPWVKQQGLKAGSLFPSSVEVKNYIVIPALPYVFMAWGLIN
jgi:hypothetical protein